MTGEHATVDFEPHQGSVIVTEAKNQDVRMFWSSGQDTGLDAAVAVIDKVNTEMGPNVFIHSLIVTFNDDLTWLCEAAVS